MNSYYPNNFYYLVISRISFSAGESDGDELDTQSTVGEI
jgi:hypothetical protein